MLTSVILHATIATSYYWRNLSGIVSTSPLVNRQSYTTINHSDKEYVAQILWKALRYSEQMRKKEQIQKEHRVFFTISQQ